MNLTLLLSAAAYIIAASWAVYHNLLYKRDSRSATGWIMISLLVPFGGPLAYYLFGINRVHKRASGFKKGFLSVDYEIGSSASTEIENTSSKGIRTVGYRVTGHHEIRGNVVKPLHDGDTAYPAMLTAIENAKSRVLLTTYIFKSDEVGSRFLDALNAAKCRGVDVRVIIDGIGDFYSLPRSSLRLAKIGINVIRFLPPQLLPPSVYINLRNHRKLLIVDNRVGFVGGMNISAENSSDGAKPKKISDLHFQVFGPVVKQLTELFTFDWRYANGVDSSDDEKQPHYAYETNSENEPPAGCGEMDCRIIADGPDENLDSLALVLQTAISAAKKSLAIMTPYFLPNRELLSAIESAALRGVKVRIILPAKNNLPYMHWANRSLLVELLRWGIKVVYQPAPFAHSKMLCIDDDYSLIGSANLDTRSLRLNFEVGLEVFSTDLNSLLTDHFDEVFARSTPVTIAELETRSIPIRLRDSLAALLSPYL